MAKVTSITTSLTLPSEAVTLYRDAFARYGIQALWNIRLLDDPTGEDAMVVAGRLRLEGDMSARALAEEIERICRAAL